MHVAGYGPKALAVAGRVGDGVIIQLADPDIIQWIMDTAREGGRGGGARPGALKCIVCAPSHISDDLADAREQVRWFPAMVSNHVLDLIDRYGTDGSVDPEGAHRLRRRRGSSTTTTSTPASARSTASSSPTRSATASACSATPSRRPRSCSELESIGVDQFNIYLMTDGQEETLEAYGREIIPRFAGVTGGAA